ncbi:MAG: RagB/SusD family nutrient uptake outer membrane protein [Bacteroidota bacterium]|nr:RagB/SusD family nutrient uptake outer membrane protein [Bacteroidota bacterium]
MKKNRILFWSLMLTIPIVVAMSGCKKFLDRKPLTATLDDLHQGSLEGQVLNLYTALRNSAGFSTLPWLDFHSIRDDDAQKGSDNSDGKEIVTEFETFQYNKDDWAINSYWDDHYAMINKANNAIATAQELNATDDATLRNVGEACFFRAYSYFELVKNFGEVPLINYRIVNPSDGIRNKSTIDSLYAFIDSNLKVAVQYLPLNALAYGTGYKGRLTSGAANTLWAQTYLFRKDWAKVISLCNQVIASGQYSLTPNFYEIWVDKVNGVGKNGPESIFEMQATDGAGAQSNGAVDYGTAWGTCQQIRKNGAPIGWNLGWGWNTPTQNLVDDWDNTDPRKNQTILYSGQYDGGTTQGGFGATIPAYTNPDGSGGLAQKYWNKKLYTGNDPAMRQFTGFLGTADNNGGAPWINHRILRYADVILMLAEASNEMGDGATAEAMLEQIRARARGSNSAVLPHIAFADQVQMRTAIKNERRWEFALEGYRFYDLVRWGDADAVLSGLGYTHRCRYYPIPQKAIDLSGNVLKQNPEW